MNKKELPKVVVEVLKEISGMIKRYNDTHEVFKLVVKPSDEYLLKIYPKGYEDLFFKLIMSV